MKKYSQLADLWGYNNRGEHTKFERRTQGEVWMQYLTDILFRPLAETKQGFAIGTNWKFNSAIAFYFKERETPTKKQREKARQIIADYFESLGESMRLYKQLMQEALPSYDEKPLVFLMIHVSRLLYAIGQLQRNEDLRDIFKDEKLKNEHESVVQQFNKGNASTITFDSDSSVSSDSDSDDYFSEENKRKRKEEARKRDEEMRKLREDFKKMEEEEEKEKRLDELLGRKRQKTQRLKL